MDYVLFGAIFFFFWKGWKELVPLAVLWNVFPIESISRPKITLVAAPYVILRPRFSAAYLSRCLWGFHYDFFPLSPEQRRVRIQLLVSLQ